MAAATELFYEEGVHTVGIDRVIERAGVAKASLYSTFGSKEELVRAYLEGRAEARRQRIEQRMARHDNPRDRILGIFDGLAEAAALPTFRGCAFVNASAEGPRGETPVSLVCAGSRSWLRGLFITLAREAGAADADRVGHQLMVIYDGATIGAAMEREPGAVTHARAMAALLIDSVVPPGDAPRVKPRAGARAGRAGRAEPVRPQR